MALDPRKILRTDPMGTALPAAPLAGTRKQRLQRLQIGLFGMATMVLLVGLANIIITSAQENQAAATPDAIAVPVTEDVPPPSRDPLADAGVAPDLPDDPEVQAVETAVPPDPEMADVPPPPSQD